MGFIKIREYKGKEDTIINTDMIVRIERHKDWYHISFPGTKGDGYTYFIVVDTENAQKIFDEIGLDL